METARIKPSPLLSLQSPTVEEGATADSVESDSENSLVLFETVAGVDSFESETEVPETIETTSTKHLQNDGEGEPKSTVRRRRQNDEHVHGQRSSRSHMSASADNPVNDEPVENITVNENEETANPVLGVQHAPDEEQNKVKRKTTKRCRCAHDAFSSDGDGDAPSTARFWLGASTAFASLNYCHIYSTFCSSWPVTLLGAHALPNASHVGTFCCCSRIVSLLLGPNRECRFI